MTTLLENHNGDLSSRVLNLKDERAKDRKICRGRELLFMVYDIYTSDPSFGALFDIQDLIGVKLINDKIEAFLNRWDHVLIHLTEPPSTQLREGLFVEQVKSSKKLQVDYQAYYLAKPGTDTRSYQYLYNAAKAVVERERRERARKKALKGWDDNPGLAADDPPKLKGKGKGKKGKGKGKSGSYDGYLVGEVLCYFYGTHGNCKKGDSCPFSHDKSKAKSKARNPSQSPSRVGRAPCMQWTGEANSCQYGKSCRFRHDSPNTLKGSGGNSRGNTPPPGAKRGNDERGRSSSPSNKESKGARKRTNSPKKAAIVAAASIDQASDESVSEQFDSTSGEES